MNKKKMVTVVVLVYNNCSGLATTVESILTQDYPEIEIIVSDDGTPNSNEERLWRELAGLIQAQREKIEVIYQPVNLGIVAHANKVASGSKGDYVKFLPPGDKFCSTHALSDLVDTIEHTNTQIVTSPALIQNATTGHVVYQFPSAHRIQKLLGHSTQEVFETIARANIISAVGTIYHRNFFEQGGFDSSYRYLDDWPTWLRMSRENHPIGILSTPTVYYAMDGISNQFGTAFESRLLHDDLVLCHEKEIIPYQKQMNMMTRWIVGYHYGSLLGRDDVLFQIRYSPMRLFCNVKKCVKKILLTGKSHKSFFERLLKRFRYVL